MTQAKHPSSFRDPSGFVFRNQQGTLLRQVNQRYQADYELLMQSNLYQRLVDQQLLIDHEEVSLSNALTEEAVCVIRPRELTFVTYPYEWAFSALRDAACLTLDIQMEAMNCGMSLKDASGFNVQFDGNKPIFIDSLSFERLQEGRPWSAYGQFCRHFLAPLALMAKRDIRLGRMLAVHLDGIPLDLASKLLPARTKLRMGLLLHLHIHAKMVGRHSESGKPNSAQKKEPRRAKISSTSLTSLLQNLRRVVASLDWKPNTSAWIDYYNDNSYSDTGFQQKKTHVQEFLTEASPKTVWDLGANTGTFSRLATAMGAKTIAFDVDPACVEQAYRLARKNSETNLLPLCLDLTNPSPACGWSNEERQTITERGPVDVVLALAVVHHLALVHNVPLSRIANLIFRFCRTAVVEFVPKSDPQAQRLLSTREDVFSDYDQANFEKAFSEFFTINASKPIGNDGRILYYLKSKPSPLSSPVEQGHPTRRRC